MAPKVKDINKAIEKIFKDTKDNILTHEELIVLFQKTPTIAVTKKILAQKQLFNVDLMSSREHAKRINELEYQKKEEARIRRQESSQGEEFDLLKNKELLEWSRSDSPVRMYLREMGKVPLLTKEEEIEISQSMEKGENTILDAICSVPYLIDFILEYKEPLVNRERKVKELFKNFDDDNDSDNQEVDGIDDLEEAMSEDDENKAKDKKLDKRAQKIIEAFKLLEKAKKDWMKFTAKEVPKGDTEIDVLTFDLLAAYKKRSIKESLVELGPTSKLIAEIVKAMETSLGSDNGFEVELKRLEYKLPLFNDTLLENHKKLLEKILTLSKIDIIGMVPEATMVSTYMEIKKLYQTAEASEGGFDLEEDEL